MKCRYCNGEIDSFSTKCPYCGSMINLEEKKELEQLNKDGCPKCHSSNIVFNRENAGTQRNKNGSTRTLYMTKGICKDCGYTWTTDKPYNRNLIWLWILGFVCCFPIPLTILFLRKKDWSPKLKYGIIGGMWVLFLIIIIAANINPNNKEIINQVTETKATVITTTTTIEETTTTETTKITESENNGLGMPILLPSSTTIEENINSSITSEPSNETKQKTPKSNNSKTIVYVSNTGKYHLNKKCSGIKKYKKMTLKQAKAKHYKACKKCT